MKKTIVTLLALCGVATAAPFTFSGPESSIKLPTAYDLSESWDLSIEVCISPFNASKVEGYAYHKLDTNLNGTAILTSNDGVLSVFAPSNFKVNSGNKSYCNFTIGTVEASFATNDDGTIYCNTYMDTSWEIGSAYLGAFNIDMSYDSDTNQIEVMASVGEDRFIQGIIENVDIAEGTLLTELSTGITQEQLDSTLSGYAMWGLPTVSFSGTEASAVPEPTTATLSLLALAGLAARRRRK